MLPCMLSLSFASTEVLLAKESRTSTLLKLQTFSCHYRNGASLVHWAGIFLMSLTKRTLQRACSSCRTIWMISIRKRWSIWRTIMVILVFFFCSRRIRIISLLICYLQCREKGSFSFCGHRFSVPSQRERKSKVISYTYSQINLPWQQSPIQLFLHITNMCQL